MSSISLRALRRSNPRKPLARWSSSTPGSSPPANPLPAFFLRGGTSKGIFLHRDDLPADRSLWTRIFLGIMGSPDPEHGRQLNGMGGGVSSLSKIVVVGPAPEKRTAKGVDVEYTFVQVGIRTGAVDYSGNCGNLSSMVGAYAVDRMGCAPRLKTEVGADGERRLMGTVRALNTNTNKVVETTFPIGELTPGQEYHAFLDSPEVSIAGVPGKASPILLDFLAPSGARTGELLPTGNPIDLAEHLAVGPSPPASIPLSLVDATNPTVFVTAADLSRALNLPPDLPFDFHDKHNLIAVERIRKAGAVLMGLDPTAHAQPKIAILSAPGEGDADADIAIHAYSMGVLHKTVPMTVGLCLGVAAQVPSTNAWEMTRAWREREKVNEGKLLRIRHPGGVVEVGADFEKDGSVRSAKVMRTGRRLMMGWVWW